MKKKVYVGHFGKNKKKPKKHLPSLMSQMLLESTLFKEIVV